MGLKRVRTTNDEEGKSELKSIKPWDGDDDG